MLPNMEPKIFSLSAVIVGYLLIDDLTANEQNALGNWLMLVAQVLCTNAFYKQVQQERQSQKKTPPNNSSEVEILEKMLRALEKEINNLKSNILKGIRIDCDFTLKIKET